MFKSNLLIKKYINTIYVENLLLAACPKKTKTKNEQKVYIIKHKIIRTIQKCINNAYKNRKLLNIWMACLHSTIQWIHPT